MKTFTFSEAKAAGFNSDCLEAHADSTTMGHNCYCSLVETTVKELYDLDYNFYCANPLHDWAYKFPRTRVRTCLCIGIDNPKEKFIVSPNIWVESKEEANAIEEASGLRAEYNQSGWNYFEDE